MIQHQEIGNKVLDEAQKWLGTPYRHQGYKCQIGCDCLGLIRGIWISLYGSEPEKPAPYARDWAERANSELMMDAAKRYFGQEIALDDMKVGDLLLFRWQRGSVVKHAGILSSSQTFIHAYERAGVIQSPLVPSWRRRIVSAFRFPF